MNKHRKTHVNQVTPELDAKNTVVGPSLSYEGQPFDIMLHAWVGKTTGWLSPASLGLAGFDWLSHLIISPAKQISLAQKGWENVFQYTLQAINTFGVFPFCADMDINMKCVKPRSQDHRFKDPSWELFPFNLYSQGFLLYENWWNNATTNIRGVSKHHEHVVNFAARQILDMIAPSNSPFTNPEVISATIDSGGANFVSGFNNFVEDVWRIAKKQPPVGSENFPVGKKVAATTGKVIYRNNLIELIQYEPNTSEVYAEPILIIPAWIMKYYILDLSAKNSLVKYLVDKGHTVFMISWKNPGTEDRNLGLEDYLNLGIMESIKIINNIVPNTKIHVTGYCLGGTLLMIAAAALAERGEEYLKTITLFAAQVDFRDPGELSLFIDQSQISYLEDIMWEKGYLDGPQMAWAFSMLRSNDLIWSRVIHDYLLGKRKPINDLIAWDHDTTRLPYRMHSEYLHDLFLNNDLVQGRYKVGKQKVVLIDIKEPIFAVSTLKDHVSPWKSVYRVHLFTNTEVTFVLTSGGHNAGIVSEPGHKGRTFQMDMRKVGDKHISSENWVLKAPKYDGSWWPEWEKWLAEHSSAEKISPPSMGDAKKGFPVICDAPGTYVYQK